MSPSAHRPLHTPQGFNRWLDKKLRKSAHKSLLVYPEGEGSLAALCPMPCRACHFHAPGCRCLLVVIIKTVYKLLKPLRLASAAPAL